MRFLNDYFSDSCSLFEVFKRNGILLNIDCTLKCAFHPKTIRNVFSSKTGFVKVQ